MTAGAHSIQPSRRSAFAPSDSGGFLRRLVDSTRVPASAVAWVMPSPRPVDPSPTATHSWDQSLRVQRVLYLALHGVDRRNRVLAARRGQRVRDDDGDALIGG